MNHIRRAAYFNSNGAALLAVGDTKKAFQSFQTSLKTLATAIEELGDAVPPPDNEVATAATDSRTNHIGVSRAVHRSPMACQNDAPKDPSPDELGQPYLYSKALVFSPNSTATCVDLAFYNSVVVFNLVLTYHGDGKSMQEGGLKKLLALYDLCLSLLGEGSRTSQYDCTILMVVTLNNKSVIHSELGQHAEARRMLYHVWDVMKHPERRPGLLETCEVEGIFLNIYLILFNCPQVAGAA
jgi:hypothetical protein